jgi:hypothetical protein
VFGDQAARGEIFSRLEGMPAVWRLAVQACSKRASQPSITATVFGVVLLLIGATSVFMNCRCSGSHLAGAGQGPQSHIRLIRTRLLSSA